MVDNLKSAVLKRIVGKDPVFNPKYLDFATHHGFTIVPYAVGKGNEKGRVESAVGYVKKTSWPVLISRILMRSSRRSFTGLTPWQTLGFTAKPVKGRWTGCNENDRP
jgi:transposase